MFNNLTIKKIVHNMGVFGIFAFISQMGMDMMFGRENPFVYIWLAMGIIGLIGEQFLKD